MILRWVLLVDGEEVPEADIRVIERDGRSVTLLTDANEEIELTRWREGGEPARFLDTLGGSQRRSSRG